MGEEYQAVGFGGAEVEGDGAHALGVPFWQGQVGVRRLEVDWVKGGNIFALEYHVTLEFHLGVNNAGEPGQLQAYIVVLVHHLGKKKKVLRLAVLVVEKYLYPCELIAPHCQMHHSWCYL